MGKELLLLTMILKGTFVHAAFSRKAGVEILHRRFYYLNPKKELICYRFLIVFKEVLLDMGHLELKTSIMKMIR